MNIHAIISIVDILLWIIIAANVVYLLFFSLASLLPKKKQQPLSITHQHSTFLVLFPAYHEDAVILNSVRCFLQQDYPQEYYRVVVVSDHMQPETNQALALMPITLLQPSFERSSKAKALQYAIEQNGGTYDYVIILDADNVVKSDFLTSLNQIVNKNEAIQCHRTAKNANNDIAALDGLSEEINNSIFRRGHNRIGMSSALIGSGMCFNYQWFKKHVGLLDSAVEDRELETLLIKQGLYIHYIEDIYVTDEKVSDSDTFQRQRLRWMTGQVQALCRMIPYLPKAIFEANINYIDKTIQQALIPRSILLVITPVFTMIATLYTLDFSGFAIKWWIVFILLILSIFAAIPAPLRDKALIRKITTLPLLVWRMLKNISHIRLGNKEFIHTTHQQ